MVVVPLRIYVIVNYSQYIKIISANFIAMRVFKNCFNLNAKTKFGFTLLELLVVIAIITMFNAAIVASVSNERRWARDARRKFDLNQIRIAIALYLTTNSALPGSFGPGNCNPSSGCNSTESQPWIPGLTSEYIQVLPISPLNSANFRYRYRPSADLTYELDAPVEADYFSAQADGGNENTCPSSATCRYEIGTDLTRLRDGP